MAGNTDNIHGWNPLYRNRNVDPGNNFDSFGFNYGRPGNFNYRRVTGIQVYDHQGHIVPQNMLNIVLDPLMIAMSEACNNAGDVVNFINNQIPARPWLQQVLNYVNALPIAAPEAAFFDWGTPVILNNAVNAETRVGGFFSIMTWNPVNICRAPVDAQRGNYPGNAVDVQVFTYLDANNSADPACLTAIQNIINIPNNAAAIETFLSACSATLAAQLIAGAGFYAFPWKANSLAPGVLIPA
ncbi:hypothetical protein [Methylobacter tundripaludum]|uniref:Uncharacterized protein n=1 Tax=Methylobacter tundripaludum (strain ATCC BAA-1195 / DSM 17260 / SV96) TaxID=697282 RepID=G3IQN9_METTV|nr:hypothetical protein [Methylobacter tundripaludum]EGW23239.1 hypothetical protein Mettu_2087 [Methylobacter tundripaludum SV96]